MTKQNCWDYKNCGREEGGEKSDELGVCPAAKLTSANEIHGGLNGGRACWAIVGTLCGNKVQGTFVSKMGSCRKCDFYQIVRDEELIFKDNSDIMYQIKIGKKD